MPTIYWKYTILLSQASHLQMSTWFCIYLSILKFSWDHAFMPTAQDFNQSWKCVRKARRGFFASKSLLPLQRPLKGQKKHSKGFPVLQNHLINISLNYVLVNFFQKKSRNSVTFCNEMKRNSVVFIFCGKKITQKSVRL